MSGSPPQEAAELRLAPESIEELAGRIAEILAAARPAPTPTRPKLISAEEVARWWGIGRRWVYEHADELGARRLGAGPRPRLRFDPEEVAARLGSPAEGRIGADGRRSRGRLAFLAEQSYVPPARKKTAGGGGATPPRPGAGQAARPVRLLGEELP